MLMPADVLQETKQRGAGTDAPIRFYWVDVSSETGGGDRDGFVRSLHERAGDYPLRAVILRTPGFRDPNSVMNDLAEVLEGCKSELLGADMRGRIGHSGHVDIVLVARRELNLAITSSPVLLPKWFPLRAGEEVTAKIEDLTWTTRVSLSSAETHVGDLRRLLHDLDSALVDRLSDVGGRDTDRRSQMAFLDAIKTTSERSLPTHMLWDAARSELQAVRNARDYRPRSIGPTPVSRLWRATQEESANRLPRLAKDLAKALQVRSEYMGQHDESVVAVLGRPVQPIADPTVRWAFDVIVTVVAASQLSTAAAHADAYARYPARLVGALSRGLRRAIDAFIRVLEAAPD